MTSMRGTHPRLFDTLDRALDQAGLAGQPTPIGPLDADIMYSWVVSNLNRTRTVIPWMKRYSRDIMEREQGFDSVVLFIAGCAIGRMARGEDPKESVNESTNDWRRSISSYWQAMLDVKPEAPLSWENTDDTWLEHHMSGAVQPPPIWDGELEDERLVSLFHHQPKIKDIHRELIMHLADGLDITTAAERMGVHRDTGHQRIQRIRQLAAA